jgi:hypothetical protein
MELEPNETRVIQFEFTPDKEPGIFSDEIVLVSDCADRKIGTVSIETWTDVDNPMDDAVFYENCDPDFDKGFELIVTDEGPRQFGLKSIEILQKDNLLTASSFAFPDFAEITGNLINPREDGFISIIAIDSADNEMIFEEIISGLTLRLGENDEASIDFGNVLETTKSCKFVTLENYGSEEMILDEFDLGTNPMFSIPASQFPIVLSPGESFDLEICFKPELGNDLEEIDLAQFILEDCLVLDIDLAGIGITYESQAESRCKLDLKYFSDNIPNFSFADEARPNPVTNTTNIRVGFAEDREIILELYSSIGNNIETIYTGDIRAGITDMSLEFNDIDNGSYLLIIRSDDFLEAKTIILER